MINDQTDAHDIPLKKSKLQGWPKFLLLILVSAIALLLILGFLTNEKVNIIVMGVEGTRTDTMIFVSIDTKTNSVQAISIPRDTYFPTPGRNGAGQAKLNAVYGFKEIGGPIGVRDAISRLLGTKIDYYVVVDYDGVKEMVDLIGGVEVDVPFRMKYDDPYSKPPLHIDFQPGVQTINGDQAMAYLRFRKNNDGSHSGGDIKRMERQQDFLKSAAKSAIQFKLPYIVARSLSYVETDMPLTKGIVLATAMLGTDSESIHLQTLPSAGTGTGKDGLSYFYYDAEGTKALIEQIMGK
ncbi:MAG TPA: LytR family transcriptional regulator [Clostridiales bacterium UBA8960]|nr:LytR family transcriptional regulator [Clostridiales bacterium UBA8960]